MNDDTFKFVCPTCGQRLSTLKSAMGTLGLCPACNDDVLAPKPSTSLRRYPLILSFLVIATAAAILVASFLHRRTHAGTPSTRALGVSDNQEGNILRLQAALIGTKNVFLCV
jgi:hypothetical protein